MKLKNVINPFGVTFEDFKNPAFQEGMASVLFYIVLSFAIGFGIGELLK